MTYNDNNSVKLGVSYSDYGNICGKILLCNSSVDLVRLFGVKAYTDVKEKLAALMYDCQQ